MAGNSDNWKGPNITEKDAKRVWQGGKKDVPNAGWKNLRDQALPALDYDAARVAKVDTFDRLLDEIDTCVHQDKDAVYGVLLGVVKARLWTVMISMLSQLHSVLGAHHFRRVVNHLLSEAAIVMTHAELDKMQEKLMEEGFLTASEAKETTLPATTTKASPSSSSDAEHNVRVLYALVGVAMAMGVVLLLDRFKQGGGPDMSHVDQGGGPDMSHVDYTQRGPVEAQFVYQSKKSGVVNVKGYECTWEELQHQAKQRLERKLPLDGARYFMVQGRGPELFAVDGTNPNTKVYYHENGAWSPFGTAEHLVIKT